MEIYETRVGGTEEYVEDLVMEDDSVANVQKMRGCWGLEVVFDDNIVGWDFETDGTLTKGLTGIAGSR